MNQHWSFERDFHKGGGGWERVGITAESGYKVCGKSMDISETTHEISLLEKIQ